MEMMKMFGFNEVEVYRFALSLAVIFISILIAISIDLRSGWKKAKKRGESTTSAGLRMTVKKLNEYGTAILFGIAPDLICFVVGWFSLPFITAGIALFFIIVEIKSVYEKAENKAKYKDAAVATGRIVINATDKEEIIKILTEYLENEKENSKGIEK